MINKWNMTLPLMMAMSSAAIAGQEAVPADDWSVDWNAAQTSMQEGDHEAARDHLKKVVRRLPGETSSLILLARCEARLSRGEAAIDALRQAVASGWEDVEQLINEPDLAVLRDTKSFDAILDSARANKKRRYLLIVGKAATRNDSPPLVLLHHGRGELPNTQADLWRQAADKCGWVLIVPKGVKQLGPVYAWETSEATKTWQVDREAILRQSGEILSHVRKTYRNSPCVVAGFSQGSVAALKLLAQDDNPFDGAVLFASAFPSAEQDPSFAESMSLQGKVVLLHVGDEDRWRDGNRSVAHLLEQAGAQVSLREWARLGHDMPRRHTQVIIDSVNSVLRGRGICSNNEQTDR
jgi:predicted esterase